MPDRGHPTESHYRQIVQSAVDYAIISCDLEARVTSWNEGARRVLGWHESEMLGRRLHSFYAPSDAAAGEVEREMATAARDGRAIDERWHVRKDGARVWAAGELMPLRDEDGGRISGFVKILRDRTERLHADLRMRELNETLTASEARLQLALSMGGMGVWEFDLRTEEVKWWPGMESIHGLPPGTCALHVTDYLRLIHPDDRERVIQAGREAIARGTGQHLEYRIVWPDGGSHWLEVRGRLLPDARGEPRGWYGVCLDITARKRVESDLTFVAAASAELASLSDYPSTLSRIAHLAVPHFADWCAVDMQDETGSLKRVAVAHRDPAKEALALELHRRFPQEPGHFDRGGPFNVLRTGRVERVGDVTDQVLERAISNPPYLAALRELGLRSYLGVPLALRGKVLGVMSFMTDESGRRYSAQDQALAQDLAARAAVALENVTLLRQLQESDRAKDVFLATLAHELRNPLAPVWNGVSIIKRMPENAARVRHVAELIERQVGQLSRLVDDLLDVSRISTGKIELQKRPADLIAIVRSAIETSRPHIDAARHRLSVRFPAESCELEADPVRLAQVFSNLLNNAAKYTRPGGAIEVDVEAEPQQLVVRVRDSGAGIAPEMLSKVFVLFTQATHPSERRQGGLGIGLSLAEGLVRLHGGSIEARSAGLDQGSEFIVCLPRIAPAALGFVPQSQSQSQSQSQCAPQAAADPDLRGKRRLLVVDDNRDAATTVAELLQMLGSQVSVVHDGLSAVAEVERSAPDLVLLDIGLPDINGYEVARRIRAMEGLRQPRLIALTGWGQEQDKRLAAEAGFDEHWTKPVDPRRLQDLGL